MALVGVDLCVSHLFVVSSLLFIFLRLSRYFGQLLKVLSLFRTTEILMLALNVLWEPLAL